MDADYTDTNPALGALYGGHLDVIKSRHDLALEKAGASHAVLYSGNPVEGERVTAGPVWLRSSPRKSSGRST